MSPWWGIARSQGGKKRGGGGSPPQGFLFGTFARYFLAYIKKKTRK